MEVQVTEKPQSERQKKRQNRRFRKLRQKNNQFGKYGDVKFPLHLKALPEQILRFRRSVAGYTVTQQAIADTFGAYQVTLNGLPDYAEFTALFDQYKIELIEINFKPVYNMQNVVSTATAVMPRLLTAMDYDDVTNWTSKQQAWEYETMRETNFDKEVTRRFKPKVAKALYAGTFNGYSVEESWIDCNSPDVQHYGLKWCVTGGSSGQTALQQWAVKITAYLAFKYVR